MHSCSPTSVVPAGYPIDNTYIAIVDSGMSDLIVGDAHSKQKRKINFAPVEKGAEGEIWIGGMGLAIGYTRDDPAVSGRFVDVSIEDVFRAANSNRSIAGVEIPSSQSRSIRFFRTGDRGQFLMSGE